jgi:beta-glucosidase/6-phospho-beta-glucosidase/beta-galactosidase
MDMQDVKLSQEQQDQLLFMMLVQQHEQIGMMGLGKIKNPVTDKLEPDINSAKYAIDTLNMMERYTSGNLNTEMKSYLQHVLSTLRLNFVDVKNSEKSKSADTLNETPDLDAPKDSPESELPS